jgi:diguanylate cyclase (GGDEF)-like protein
VELNGVTPPHPVATELPNASATTLQKRLWIASLFCGVVGLVAATGVMVAHQDFGKPSVLVGLIVVSALSWGASAHLSRRGDVAGWQADPAIFVAAFVLLPPAGVACVFVAGTALGHVVGLKPVRTLVLNTGQRALAASLAVCVAAPVATAGSPVSARMLAAAAVASAMFALTNDVVIDLYLTFGSGSPFWSELASDIRFASTRVPVLAAVGFMAGAAGQQAGWIALLAIPPVAATQFVLTEHMRAKGDRERISGLFEAASSAHASMRSGEVQASITSAAARLLNSESASIVTETPVDGTAGVRMHTSDGVEHWLVVENRITGAPLEEQDLALLDTLAAVGASALDNARLVEQIQHQALHDPLTGLANHLLFEDRVTQALNTARRARERLAVFMLDIDAFKKVNDSLGHPSGNELLRLLSDRLSGAVREVDTVGRLGGDHFTILMPGVGTAEIAGVMAQKLLEAVRRPVMLGGHELFMTASVGVAFYPEDGTRAEHLLRNADSAMHRAKDNGRNGYQIYASGMNELAHLRLARESELHNAVQRNELRVRYQPQIDLRTGRMVGVEALVRWEHPVLGLIPPVEFVPLAEETDLITEVDAWVLLEACRQGKRWLDEGLPTLRVAVNLSGRHFNATDRLYETIVRVLDQTGLDPAMLELEVTEGIAVGESDAAIHVLKRLRALGVQLSIDDFGTGYSMLGRLQDFPIDRLKIDRSFVSKIDSSTSEAPIVAAMIAMARSMKIEVVAEGVETLEQQTYLRNKGCDQAQGYLYSHPVEASEIAALACRSSVGLNVTAVSL